MVKLIKLHRWVGNRMSPTAAAQNGAPVWVNPSMITQMGQYEGVVVAQDGPLTYADRPKELVTSISFPAATHEDVDGVSVIETPDEIMAAIAGGEMATFQSRLARACVPLFHDDPTDIPERLARFFEESNEVCQSMGMTREDAHALVDYTYDRPPGYPHKEIGAVLITLGSLCIVSGQDMVALGEADLAKLQHPLTIARIRAKRATRHGRGPLPGYDAEGRTNG